MLNLGDEGSGFQRLVPDDQRPVRPHPHHEAAGKLDALDGSSKTESGEGKGLGHVSDFTALFGYLKILRRIPTRLYTSIFAGDD